MAFVAVAAGVGAIGSIVGGALSAGAQKDAARQQAQLGRDQIAENARQYNQSRADLAPYRDAGYTSLKDLVAGTRPGGQFDKVFTNADFVKDPGYQFRMAEGARGVEASAAARGGALSGGALKALARYQQGYASNEFGAAYDRFNSNLTGRYNRLAGLAGTGQTATNTGIAAGQDMNRLNASARNGIANAIGDAGDATASQYAGIGQTISSTANNLSNYFANRPTVYQRLNNSASQTINDPANAGIF
ncbi:MAG: hypothetical protein WCL10_18770 [Novosphingobium sp.]|uniref:hypothetical protein n=1 Tax=Novosphingobium sp. TaxID=1874826 RepID=UPI003018AB9B